MEEATEEGESCCIDWAALNNADDAVDVVDTEESSSSIDLTGDASNLVAADAMPPESFLVDEAALTAVRMAWRFCVVSQPRDSRYAASAKVSPGVISSVIERYETTFLDGAGFDSAAEKAATAACGVAGAPGVCGVEV